MGTEDRGDIWIHEHRDDGLLLRRSIVDVDGSLFDVQVNTYLGPDTWQLATQNGVQLEWDDDCRTLDPPTSYYADGRIAWRIHGTGSEQSMERWTYADDSWRVAERVFVHASGHTERRLHTWTPL